MGRAGKATVSKQGNGITQPSSHECRRHSQHLAHSRTSFGSFIADDDHAPGFDLTPLHSLKRVFFTVEDSRRAAVGHPLVTSDLDHASLRSQIASQDHEPPSGFKRAGKRPYDFLPLRLTRAPRCLTDRLTGNGQRVGVNQAAFHQTLGDQLNSTRCVEIAGHEAPARLEVSDDGRARADAVKVVNVQFDSRFAGDGQQVQDRVSGASCRGDCGDGVFDGFACKDLRRAEVTAQKFHNELSSVKRRFVLLIHHGGDAVASQRRDAEEFQHRGHGVGGELTAAGARARTGRVFDRLELCGADLAATVCAHRLEHVLDGEVASC